MTSKKKARVWAAGLVAVALGLAAAAPAWAESKTPTVGVVDVQVILQRSEAARSVQQAIDGYRQSLAKEFSGREEKLRATDEELGRQRAIDQSINEAMGTIQKNLVDVVKSVADDQGVTLVLSGQQVVWLSDKSLDLTQAVLDELNKRLPRVSVKLSDAKK